MKVHGEHVLVKIEESEESTFKPTFSSTDVLMKGIVLGDSVEYESEKAKALVGKRVWFLPFFQIVYHRVKEDYAIVVPLTHIIVSDDIEQKEVTEKWQEPLETSTAYENHSGG